MVLCDDTLTELRKIINGDDVPCAIYRKGQDLVKFFNKLGSNEIYESGFPSRWKYTDEKLRQINFQFYSYVLEMMLQVFRSIFKCHRCKKSSEDELKAIKTKNDSGAVSYENIRIFNGSLRWYSATPI